MRQRRIDIFKVVDESARIDSLPRWFSGVEMNFAENILFTQKKVTKGGLSTVGKEDYKVAVTEVREGSTEIRQVTWGELRKGVGKLAQAMKAAGVKRGDRIAGAYNATHSRQFPSGLNRIPVLQVSREVKRPIWKRAMKGSFNGILDRLLQIEPKYLFMDDWAIYNGRTVDLRDKMTEIVEKLHGTTGTPKCIVHSVGTGWIMYLSSVCSMLVGARLVLYDGSPFKPDPLAFIRLIGEQKVTHLGISPRYLHELQKNGISPRDVTDLSSLQIATCTGMVLSDALFGWFYDAAFPPTTQLANISGGTDIAGCFALGNPLTPLYSGGCQGPCLGTAIAVYDQTVEGNGVPGTPVEDGVPGELVATKPFPNMPVMFWGADGERKYFDSYFARFDSMAITTDKLSTLQLC
ncbi:hypothetical protein FGG08_000216 [Glutinoglossum americanum]|uniref:AMP-dependent synthetase/ligase domain-containing protein n=1 Tax=Glutinoglossum americanum TaxID=1670608 RepID=A0A9P8L719_9PEZI|nr:hypothetical protein FGG08_000216 [Glutinoglossum americanum]